MSGGENDSLRQKHTVVSRPHTLNRVVSDNQIRDLRFEMNLPTRCPDRITHRHHDVWEPVRTDVRMGIN